MVYSREIEMESKISNVVSIFDIARMLMEEMLPKTKYVGIVRRRKFGEIIKGNEIVSTLVKNGYDGELVPNLLLNSKCIFRVSRRRNKELQRKTNTCGVFKAKNSFYRFSSNLPESIMVGKCTLGDLSVNDLPNNCTMENSRVFVTCNFDVQKTTMVKHGNMWSKDAQFVVAPHMEDARIEIILWCERKNQGLWNNAATACYPIGFHEMKLSQMLEQMDTNTTFKFEKALHPGYVSAKDSKHGKEYSSKLEFTIQLIHLRDEFQPNTNALPFQQPMFDQLSKMFGKPKKRIIRPTTTITLRQLAPIQPPSCLFKKSKRNCPDWDSKFKHQSNKHPTDSNKYTYTSMFFHIFTIFAIYLLWYFGDLPSIHEILQHFNLQQPIVTTVDIFQQYILTLNSIVS